MLIELIDLLPLLVGLIPLFLLPIGDIVCPNSSQLSPRNWSCKTYSLSQHIHKTSYIKHHKTLATSPHVSPWKTPTVSPCWVSSHLSLPSPHSSPLRLPLAWCSTCLIVEKWPDFWCWRSPRSKNWTENMRELYFASKKICQVWTGTQSIRTPTRFFARQRPTKRWLCNQVTAQQLLRLLSFNEIGHIGRGQEPNRGW